MSVKAVSLVVAGIATIALSHSAVIAFQAKPRTVWDGVYTEEQAKRAEPLYAEKCANCHGDTMTGNDAPPLVGAEFSANWSDLTLNDLNERIRLTMPADAAGTLTRAQVSDLIALMLRHAEIPTGKADLAAGADVLKEIKFVGTKPDAVAAKPAAAAKPDAAATKP